MIRIIITKEDGTVLGATTLDKTDLDLNGGLRSEWVGDRVKEELPTDKEALAKLLGNPADNN
jgi:hypothetical protein